MPKKINRNYAPGSLKGLGKELHQVQPKVPDARVVAALARVSDAEIAERLQALRPPEANRTSNSLAAGRHIISISPDLSKESLLGSAGLQPYVHMEDRPLLAVFRRAQSPMGPALVARNAIAFGEQHPTTQDELEGTGRLKIVHPSGARFATVRLSITKGTPLYAQLLEERSQFRRQVDARRATSVIGAILCALSAPPELNEMLAKRIEHVPVTFTLGAFDVGNSFSPPAQTIQNPPELG